MSPAVRPARPADLDPVWALARRAVAQMNAMGNPQWGEDYPTRPLYAGDIARGELYVLCGEEGSVLAAACINQTVGEEYAPIPWQYSGPVVSVHRLAVDPAAQRQGAATALLTFAEALARQNGIAALHVDTYARNDRMQALFRKQGFQVRGEIRLHGRPEPFFCFEKILSAR